MFEEQGYCMLTRRTFLRASLSATATLFLAAHARAQNGMPAELSFHTALPIVLLPELPPIPEPTPQPTAQPTPQPGDAAILSASNGTVEQAFAWLAPRADPSYSDDAIWEIVQAYRNIGANVGLDWFVAIAQMAHETGHLTSFWSQRPQRNPAGIGVTGVGQADPPADTNGWAYNTQRNRWERGLSFGSWAGEAIPAHLGRLLAYALRDDQANPAQLSLIQYALSKRGITDTKRGVATTWIGLNGRWADPGTTYGQTLLALAQRMREG